MIRNLPIPATRVDDLKYHLDTIKKHKQLATDCLYKMFPVGMRVEVKLRYGQVYWTKATVHSAHVEGYGVSEWGYVTVEIDNVKPNSRQRLRRVEYKNARPIRSLK